MPVLEMLQARIKELEEIIHDRDALEAELDLLKTKYEGAVRKQFERIEKMIRNRGLNWHQAQLPEDVKKALAAECEAIANQIRDRDLLA